MTNSDARPRRRGAAVAAIGALTAISVIVVGCSDSKNRTATSPPSSSSMPASISKADFVVKAEAICHNTNVEAPAVGGGANADPATRTAAQTAVVDLFHQLVNDLRALGYPPGDQATLDDIYAGIDAALRNVQAGVPHNNIENALDEALTPSADKLMAYGVDCTK